MARRIAPDGDAVRAARANLVEVYGKLLGAGIGGCATMLIGWDPLVVFAAVVCGGVLGHFLFDREPELPRVERPKSVEELLSEGRERRAREQRQRRPVPPPPPPQATVEQRALVDALAPLFVEVGRVDGEVVGDEIRAVREFFQHELGFDEGGLEALRVALKAAIAAPASELSELVKRHRGAVKPSLRVSVLRGLYAMVLADAEMRRSERDALRHVVQHFNLSDEQLRQVTKEFFGSGEAHYATLGLTDAASDDEIRSAWRRLAAEHHPDKAAALGPTEAAAAEKRFRELKEAWEALQQLRGL